MNAPVILDRRRVLTGGGALIVSFSLTGALAQQQDAPSAAPAPKPPGSLATAPYLDSWIRIDADGGITVFTGKAVFSCVTPLLLLEGKQVTTLEGLGTIAEPAPIQRAFMEEQAAQCGYCIAGMMMRAQALLQRNSKPTDEQIRAELEPHLCRCGTHMRILRAVHRAIRLMDTADASSPANRSAQ